jgi:hypothetical protein
MKNNLLDDYLNTVERALSVLPADRRESERRELRRHLEEMIESRVLEGESETDATAGALEQFGSPRSVGLGLRTAYFRAAWHGTPAGTLLIALLSQFAAMKITSQFATHFLTAERPPAPEQFYIYFLLSAVLGAGMGVINATFAPVRRALAMTTLMQVASILLMFGGYFLTGTRLVGVNERGLMLHHPDVNLFVCVMPLQQLIALACGWVAVLCVGWHRRRNRVAVG